MTWAGEHQAFLDSLTLSRETQRLMAEILARELRCEFPEFEAQRLLINTRQWVEDFALSVEDPTVGAIGHLYEISTGSLLWALCGEPGAWERAYALVKDAYGEK